MTTVNLNHVERAELLAQDPATGADGGFQSLLVSLQEKLTASGDLSLSPSDLERIPRYAYDYGNGGWENRLESIFSRTLGAKLGR